MILLKLCLFKIPNSSLFISLSEFIKTLFLSKMGNLARPARASAPLSQRKFPCEGKCHEVTKGWAVSARKAVVFVRKWLRGLVRSTFFEIINLYFNFIRIYQNLVFFQNRQSCRPAGPRRPCVKGAVIFVRKWLRDCKTPKTYYNLILILSKLYLL